MVEALHCNCAYNVALFIMLISFHSLIPVIILIFFGSLYNFENNCVLGSLSSSHRLYGAVGKFHDFFFP